MTNVLITGGAGFVGHHIIKYLLDNTDFNIVSLDRLDFSGSLNRISEITKYIDPDVKKRVRIVYHDLKSEFNDSLINLIGHVDIIYHLAASSHVTRSIKDPIEFINNNILGTANLLEYSRKLKTLSKFIYFSTDEVFGPSKDGLPFYEWDRYNSCNPYSASKAAAEELCIAYENTYKLPIFITHTMNIYGERQNEEKFIPLLIKKISNNEIVDIHFDSSKNFIGKRCYLHALDVAHALLFLTNIKDFDFPLNHRGGNCHKFNIASLDEYDNLQVAQLIARYLNKELKYKLIDPIIDRPGHDFIYRISGDYLRSLGWLPQINFESGLKKVVEETLFI